MTTSNIKSNDNCDERFGSKLPYDPAGRLDVPRQGYVLSKAAERVGAPVRHAVRALESSLAESAMLPEVWREHYQCRKLEPASLTYRAESELAAWFVVSTWLLGVATGEIPARATLHEAEEWMLGSVSGCTLCGLIGATAVDEAETLLHKVDDVGVLLD